MHRAEQIGGKGDADHERDHPAARSDGRQWTSPSDRPREQYLHGWEIVMRASARAFLRAVALRR